jgi:ABC-type nitrate/sulfonate/bicarbonate transport system substrate-binding protein
VRACAATALLVIVLGLVYLGMQGRPAVHSSPPEKLSIALPMLPHYALVHVAVAKGYFASEGLDVSIVTASHGVAAIGT